MTHNSHDERIFRIGPSDGLDELHPSKFSNEKQMQKLIERNIDRLFPGLELLKSELSLENGRYYLDTVAFDMDASTFVVIEYKNTRDKGVLTQAKAYLNYMIKNYKDTLILEYNNTNKQRNREQFDWKAAYAVIVAPEFSGLDKDAADGDQDLELHEIKFHSCIKHDPATLDGDIITIQRVGGSHERKLSPGPELDDAEKTYLDRKRASDATRTVWHKLKESIRRELDVTFNMPWYGGGFYLPNRRLVCWLEVESDRVMVLCEVKKDQEIETDDFIEYRKEWNGGLKNYGAYVDTVDDIKDAIRFVRMAYDLKRG